MPSEEAMHSETVADFDELEAKKIRQESFLSSRDDESSDIAHKLSRLAGVVRRVIGKDVLEEVDVSLESVDIQVFSNHYEFSALVDEIYVRIISNMKPPNNERMDNESSESLGKSLRNPLYDAPCDLPENLIRYFVVVNSRLTDENQNQFLMDYERFLIPILKSRLMVQVTYILRGFFGEKLPADVMVAVFVKLFYNQIISESFLRDFVLCCCDESLVDTCTVREIFEPLLDHPQRSMWSQCMSSGKWDYVQLPYSLLRCLVSIKDHAKRRPIADLLVSRADFMPEVTSNCPGREFARLSYLGPFFEYSLSPSDDENPNIWYTIYTYNLPGIISSVVLNRIFGFCISQILLAVLLPLTIS
ncbi:hypothetical protein AB6A40_002426 [Gnathostoma spinigerum]|uniref:Uncharacterized protein n=1 Tax=Gnathostoma spinigerum TaxID=75299 RepID=A0ABD6E8T8_9BILA